jgi:hypothetical protein
MVPQLDDIINSLPESLRPGDFMGIMSESMNINNDSLNYRNVYMGYVDILGYKELIKRLGMESPQKIFRTILNSFLWAKTYKKAINVSLFSDTLVVYTNNDNPIGFWDILNLIQMFRNQMLENGYLIRGSIVSGEHFSEKGVWISPCLIKAYQYENEISSVARIVIDKKAFEIASLAVVEKEGQFGIYEHPYFVLVNKNSIEKDYDNNYVLKFDINSVEINYIKSKYHPDFKNLTNERIEHCIIEGNKSLKKYYDGLLLAKQRANEYKANCKVDYLINCWNRYIEEFQFRELLKDDFIISIA